jgi:hypothetical protein
MESFMLPSCLKLITKANINTYYHALESLKNVELGRSEIYLRSGNYFFELKL